MLYFVAKWTNLANVSSTCNDVVVCSESGAAKGELAAGHVNSLKVLSECESSIDCGWSGSVDTELRPGHVKAPKGFFTRDSGVNCGSSTAVDTVVLLGQVNAFIALFSEDLVFHRSCRNALNSIERHNRCWIAVHLYTSSLSRNTPLRDYLQQKSDVVVPCITCVHSCGQ